MASKYAGLKGRIPGEPTPREAALVAELEASGKKTVAELTAEYNLLKDEAAELAAAAKRLSVRLDARKILILKKIDESGGDGYKGLNGYTWSEGFEPYPVCDDPAAAVKYFRDNDMADQLELRSSEISSRVESFVKDEALRGELKVVAKKEIDPATGEEREVTEIRSKIPGVKVFLDTKLSRVKVGTRITTATVS